MGQTDLDRFVAEAILGIDTLWGGDVMNPSGTGRFIADSWFSDEDLPKSYTDSAADSVRSSGGVSADDPDLEAIDAYLKAVDLPQAISAMTGGAASEGGIRGAFLEGLGRSVQVMWDLAMETLGRGDPVPYPKSVEAATGVAPTPSEPGPKKAFLAELLTGAGYPPDNEAGILGAVDAWRGDRMVPPATIPALARALIAELEAGTVANVMPYLPQDLQEVPRSNVEFLAIKDAWFSGSMNYVGRARDEKGRPKYEATYEINASLEISVPEFSELVSHEVVPGHVTTFAFIQHLYANGQVGFEGTVLTMNSRYSTLAEGIANNAALMALGLNELDQLPDDDLKIGMLLSRLQDDAKNQASFLTWNDGVAQPDVSVALRRDCLVTEERADKLSGPWARHPLLGRMYLPSYRAGTEKVAQLRRENPPEIILPALYGCRGLVDIKTIDSVV